jgi:hypothetical protein
VVQLKISEIDELAAITAGDILRAGEFIAVVAGDRGRGLTIAASCHYRFFFYCACH